jgi:hypothetical protein
MRTLFRSTIAALTAVSLFGCTDDADPLAVDGANAKPSRYEGGIENPQTTVTTSDVDLLDIQVRSPELKSTLRYQIPLADGESATGLSLPAGSGYEVAVRGYDRYGEQTFEGKTALEYVALGENKPLAVALYPTGRGERAEAMFTLAGEERAPAGLKLVIEADRKEVGEGQSAILRAYGLDARGQKVELDPRRLSWSVDDPRLGRFDLDPRKPRDPNDWIKFNVHHWLEDLRRPSLSVTYADIIVFVDLLVVKNGFVDISAGWESTCGVRRFGDVSCWGLNNSEQLGIGNATAPDTCLTRSSQLVECSTRPMTVAGNRLFSAVSVGGFHACAIERTTNHAFCWGQNDYGELGVDRLVTPFSNVPVAVSPPYPATTPLAFRSISAGWRNTCGITTTNQEICWGAFSPPAGVASLATPPVRASTSGIEFKCRMDAAGIICVNNSNGNPGSQLGSWNVMGQARVAEHVCAIEASGIFGGGATWCFGDSSNGKLGNGTTTNNRTQVLVPSPLNTVETGYQHSCGLSGVVAFCWGSNHNGQLGANNNAITTSSAPLQVTSPPTTPSWVKISTGRAHTCAIDTAEDVWCWGENFNGQIGNGTRIDFKPLCPRLGVYAPSRVLGPSSAPGTSVGMCFNARPTVFHHN